MGKIIREIDRGTRVVGDSEVRITELIWNDGGRSFEVHDTGAGDDLTTNGCFDEIPTDAQLHALLNQQAPRTWTCPGCDRRINESDADMIIDHVRGCDHVDGAGHALRATP
jgi:hypothetical protein